MDNIESSNKRKEHHFTENFFIDSLNKEIEIIFKDGEAIKGTVNWFDRWNIKLTLPDGKDCIIYRHALKGFCKI